MMNDDVCVVFKVMTVSAQDATETLRQARIHNLKYKEVCPE